MSKFHKIENEPDLRTFQCPGCGCCHAVNVAPGGWKFNGDMDKPTVTPSILVMPTEGVKRCHSFIADGMIRFLKDCEHELAGQTVELPEWEMD